MSGFAGVPNFRDIETSPCPCTQSNRSLCKHVTTGDLASRSFSSRPHLLPYPSRQLIKHERIRLAAGESLVWCLEATSSTTLATCLNTSSHSPSEASWLWGMFQAKKIVHCVTTRKLIGIISTHLKNMSEHENFPQAVEIEHQNMLKKKNKESFCDQIVTLHKSRNPPKVISNISLTVNLKCIFRLYVSMLAWGNVALEFLLNLSMLGRDLWPSIWPRWAVVFGQDGQCQLGQR